MTDRAPRWTDRLVFGVVAAVAAAAIFGVLSLNMLAPVDQTLRNLRFAASDRAPSGDMLLLDIDSASLASVGVWPWPRQVHARILDRLMQMGAAEVVFDIDFSSAATPNADRALEAALTRAGGYAYLAAFRQVAADGTIMLNLPLPRFAAQADPVLVNVDGDGTGLLRSIPTGSGALGLRTMAQTLVPSANNLGTSINIDYGINLKAIDRLSAVDLLNGKADPARIADRQVVVGASAIELRDLFRVPRFGVIPGALVQIAATETLKAGRQLTDLGNGPAGLLIALAVGAFWFARRGRLALAPLVLVGAASMVLVELGAWLVQYQLAMVLDTAIYHGALGLLAIVALLLERGTRWQSYQRQHARLAYLATHDESTGAKSRQGLLDDIEQQIAGGRGNTVILIQIDRLDRVIASLGHHLGERIARQVVGRIEQHCGLTPARIGLDMFALRIDHALASTEQGAYCMLVAGWLDQPYEVDEHEIILGTRFGSSASAEAAISATELLRQAEVALIHAREQNQKTMPFSAEQSAAIERHRLQDVALRKALQAGQFHLVFQPQVDLASKAMIGVEALMRWETPEMGLVSSAEFIPLAERTGLIVELGDWVLREACRQAAQWSWKGQLSVNVSPVQFLLGDVVASVARALAETGFPAERLELEITESLFLRDDDKVISVLNDLRATGITIALDDFGTGYSSLSYLARLPIDKLKIDQSFVRPLPDPHLEALVETIVLMARRLDKTVVVEGIETAQQADYLASLGCDIGQGYLFGRPASAQALGLKRTVEQAA